MNLQELTGAIHDAATVRTVFGDPYQVDGVTLIPVARSGGGGGAGSGRGPDDEGGGGEGGGFGFGTTPVGVYAVKDGDVRFVAAEDRIAWVSKGATVAIAAILAWRSVAKARHRRKALETKYGA